VSTPVRVLLVDDDALVRSGLRMILSSAGDIEVVGEAGGGAAALDATLAHRPDVVLMDIRMPDVDGITATGRLRALPRPPAGDRADDLPPGRLRVRGTAGGSERVPAQGHPAGGDRAGRAPGRRGRSNAEIATALHLSEATVKGYVSRLLTALDVANRVQVAIVAHDAGLV